MIQKNARNLSFSYVKYCGIRGRDAFPYPLDILKEIVYAFQKEKINFIKTISEK